MIRVLRRYGPRVASLLPCFRGGAWGVQYCWNRCNFSFRNKSVILLPYGLLVGNNTFSKCAFLKILLATLIMVITNPDMNIFNNNNISGNEEFNPHPTRKQSESETTLGSDLASTRILCSTIPFRKCFKSCSPVSDLVTRYVPQATRRFTYLNLVPFEHKTSKSEYR
jgi:hypothetical protein